MVGFVPDKCYIGIMAGKGMKTLMIAGSRHLATPEAREVVAALVRLTGRVVTGCARGVDRLAVEMAMLDQTPLLVVAAESREAAPEWVTAARNAGAEVLYMGEWKRLPRRAALAKRTAAAVRLADELAALVCPKSRGTLLAMREAVKLKKTVYAVPFAGADLPALGAGSWVPADLPGLPAVYRWQSGQTALF